MSKQPLVIGPDELRDQRERMVEEYGIPEEQAEEAFKDMKTQITLHAQELGKGWDDDTVEAVTNLVIAVQQQDYERHREQRHKFYDRIYNLFAGAFIALAGGGAGVLLVQGRHLAATVCGLLLVAFLYSHYHHA